MKKVFTGKAQKLNNGHTAVWTDGVMIDCDNEERASFYLKEGKRYKVTVEEVKD